MIAHFHAQIWNASELARSIGASENTIRRYLDILSSTYVVRQVQPWFENIKKRQVKAPKIYIRDSGILHALLSIENKTGLMRHPKYGASWEGFALEQVLQIINPQEAYFWSTHAGAELDLLIFKQGLRFGFEFKCQDAPQATKSMYIALSDLKLENICIIYPGAKTYPLKKKIEVRSIADINFLPDILSSSAQ